MKKIIASALLVGSLFSAAHAAEKDDFQFGIRMGAQFSKLKGESDLGPNFESKYAKSLVGPAFGFIFEIPVHANFEIRPELNFGSQGQKFALPGNIKVNNWMGYVQVPVLFRGQYGSDKVRGFLQAGPQFGYGAFILSRAKDGNGNKEKEADSFKDQNLKPFDAGIAIGAGVEFPAANGIEIEARYYGGMANINDYGINGLKTKNQSVSLTVAFKF